LREVLRQSWQASQKEVRAARALLVTTHSTPGSGGSGSGGSADFDGVRAWTIGWATKDAGLEKYAETGVPDSFFNP
jgi:hypothetical protein